MLTHSRIWSAIDKLARENGMSPSGLAKRAGLDSTAFNKSKRFSADGRPRWPSTESLSKISAVTGSKPEDLLSLLGGQIPANTAREKGPGVPLIGFAQAGSGGYFDDAGFPIGAGWDHIDVPGQVSASAYALQIQGNSMEPLYSDGGILVVDPEESVRRGDRVIAQISSGEVMAKVLKRRTSSIIELLSINPEHPVRNFAPSEVIWMARVIWASQ